MLNQDPRQAREYFAQKLAFVTGPYELDGQIKRREDITIVDVRLPSDFRAGHIQGAINLPNGKWQLQVFDQAGRQVFDSEDYQNNWPTEKLNSGVYYYYFKTNEQTWKGWLEIVK